MLRLIAFIGWLGAVISLSIGGVVPWQTVQVKNYQGNTELTFNPMQTPNMDIFLTCTLNRALYPMSVTALVIAGIDYIIAQRYRIIRNPNLFLMVAFFLLWCEVNWVICAQSIPDELAKIMRVYSWTITSAGYYFQAVIILVNGISVALRLYQCRQECIPPVSYTSLPERKLDSTGVV